MFGMKYAISGRQETSDSQGILQIKSKTFFISVFKNSLFICQNIHQKEIELILYRQQLQVLH